jgi:hypothetical protein
MALYKNITGLISDDVLNPASGNKYLVKKQ